mmetsp:Transcript_21055/g.58541  ORF Transcript_21055/g.58541 Transcript_21055/m.58541 type:complete len:322 (-) Transcript_21055:28-993(-)
MFRSGDDQALLNCCGVNHPVFRELLAVFEPLYDMYTFDNRTGTIRNYKSNKGGRKREMDSTGCLGLVLFWFRTRGSVARGLSMAFGLTSTPMYKWLKYGCKILLCALQTDLVAVVKLPTNEQTELYIDALARKYPVLRRHRVWAACDGIKLPIQRSGNWMKQNRFYNGWTAGTYVNCVFVFCPDGRIRACTLNAPGCWHDSTQADYGMYQKMKEMYDQYRAKVVVDSAFNLSAKDFLIKSSQLDPPSEEGVVLNRAVTSVCQLSEWGMRQIQGGFPRVKDLFFLEELGERKIILHPMVLLYNFQTSKVQVNTILNTFIVTL